MYRQTFLVAAMLQCLQLHVSQGFSPLEFARLGRAKLSTTRITVTAQNVTAESTTATHHHRQEVEEEQVPYAIARGDGTKGGGGLAMPFQEDGLRRPKVGAEMPIGRPDWFRVPAPSQGGLVILGAVVASKHILDNSPLLTVLFFIFVLQPRIPNTQKSRILFPL